MFIGIWTFQLGGHYHLQRIDTPSEQSHHHKEDDENGTEYDVGLFLPTKVREECSSHNWQQPNGGERS